MTVYQYNKKIERKYKYFQLPIKKFSRLTRQITKHKLLLNKMLLTIFL